MDRQSRTRALSSSKRSGMGGIPPLFGTLVEGVWVGTFALDKRERPRYPFPFSCLDAFVMVLPSTLICPICLGVFVPLVSSQSRCPHCRQLIYLVNFWRQAWQLLFRNRLTRGKGRQMVESPHALVPLAYSPIWHHLQVTDPTRQQQEPPPTKVSEVI